MDTNTLFGPLSKEYCLWFYLLSVVGFALFVFIIVSGIVMGISKKRDMSFYLHLFTGSLAYAIFYFKMI